MTGLVRCEMSGPSEPTHCIPLILFVQIYSFLRLMRFLP
jgi:hypothetical protein